MILDTKFRIKIYVQNNFKPHVDEYGVLNSTSLTNAIVKQFGYNESLVYTVINEYKPRLRELGVYN